MAEPKVLEGAVNVAEVSRAELEKLDSLKAWAEQPAHHWHRGVGTTAPRPGTSQDRVRVVEVLERGELRHYSIVFTITETAVGLMRHASVCVNLGAYEPLTPVVWGLLQRLGYRGTPDSWHWKKSEGKLPRVYEILEPFEVN